MRVADGVIATSSDPSGLCAGVWDMFVFRTSVVCVSGCCDIEWFEVERSKAETEACVLLLLSCCSFRQSRQSINALYGFTDASRVDGRVGLQVREPRRGPGNMSVCLNIRATNAPVPYSDGVLE